MKDAQENIEDNASSISWKGKKENIENNKVRQLALRQFFKLIIYLEDNETEENKILLPFRYP